MNSTAAGWWVAGLCAAAIAGVVAIAGLRLEGGADYPEYCSLRAEKGGTKLLADSLAGMPGYSVERNFLPLAALPTRPPRLILVAGLTATRFRQWNAADVDALEEAARAGSRLVLAFSGRMEWTGMEPDRPSPAEARWGLKMPRVTSADAQPEIGFDQPDKWQPGPAKDGRPPAFVRSIGFGEIVVVEGSHFLTNEALIDQRDTDFLVWATGGRHRVTVDDSHLGVDTKPGVVALARHYGLTSGLLLLLAAFAVFAWHRSAPLGGFAKDNDERGPIYRPTAGLRALLQRSLRRDGLVQACVAEAAADRRLAVRPVAAPKSGTGLADWYNSHLSSPRP